MSSFGREWPHERICWKNGKIRVEASSEGLKQIAMISNMAGLIWVKCSGIIENSAENDHTKEFAEKMEE